jgi:transposase-like protein
MDPKMLDFEPNRREPERVMEMLRTKAKQQEMRYLSEYRACPDEMKKPFLNCFDFKDGKINLFFE